MKLLWAFDRMVRSKAGKVVLGGTALGVGAASAAAVGSGGGPTAEPVQLGEEPGGAKGGAALNIEGKAARVEPNRSLLSDRLDTPEEGAVIDDTTHTGVTADTVNTVDTVSPDTVSPDTVSPDTVSPETPETPETPDSPGTESP